MAKEKPYQNICLCLRLTKVEWLFTVNNDMTTNYYALAHIRAYDAYGKFKRFKFVVWCDAFSVQEYYEQDTYTLDNVMEYLNITACDIVESLPKTFDQLKQSCNETIKSYNRGMSYHSQLAFN